MMSLDIIIPVYQPGEKLNKVLTIAMFFLSFLNIFTTGTVESYIYIFKMSFFAEKSNSAPLDLICI